MEDTEIRNIVYLYHKKKGLIESRNAIFNMEQLVTFEEIKLLNDEPDMDSVENTKGVSEHHMDEFPSHRIRYSKSDEMTPGEIVENSGRKRMHTPCLIF